MWQKKEKNCTAAQPVYSLRFMIAKAVKADISIAQMFTDCSQVSSNAPFRFLSLSMGDRCPLTATVWFPWAVKQDHGPTTDLTMPFDIRCFLFWHMICPFWGKSYPKDQHSVSLGTILYLWTFNLEGLCLRLSWGLHFGSMPPFLNHRNEQNTSC